MKATMLRLAAVAAVALSAQAAVAETITERLDDRNYFADGKDAWDKVCARCHTTVDGKTDQSVGPDLSQIEYDADTLKHFVRNGHLAMPAFSASHISDATIVEIADYMAKNIYKGE
ncbi:c-type cytochrome [Falsigemmobacter faecalis]|uniref:Cytochrome c n=1 Tax=Falsigemmobacter faecalis TaxID=2488730 RepID=A0A3P3D797_9RHOB|nr:cytochrome c [Falsigemmobacter faecalis]RRH70215.1 cytochrome c [Falsigemmobacter faecalis]